MKKEIERKFLLKELPILPKGVDDIQNIIQYYYLVGDVWYRIRKIDSSLNNNSIYLHTIKTYKDGICYEEERNYTNDEYTALVKEIHSGKYDVRYISKTRYIYKTGVFADFEGENREIKWEIDVFNFKLVIAEIEIPDFNFEIEIPNYLKKEIIYEVTGIKEFSNRVLAEVLKTNKIETDVTI